MAEPVADTPVDLDDFDHATAVSGGDGKYIGDVNPAWDGPLTTHGGVLSGLIVNACEAEVNQDRGRQVRTVSSQYLRPPSHGPVELEVRRLREGRRFVNLAVELKQNDRLCVTSLVTYANRGIEDLLAFGPKRPECAPAPAREAPTIEPADWTGDADGWLGFPEFAPAFFRRTLTAPRFGSPPFLGDTEVGNGPLHTGGWIRTRAPRRIDDAFLAFIVDIFYPTVLAPLRKPAMAPTLDMTTHFRAELPPDGLEDQALLVFNTTIGAAGGVADSDSLVFAEDGTLLAQARQLMLVTGIDT